MKKPTLVEFLREQNAATRAAVEQLDAYSDWPAWVIAQCDAVDEVIKWLTDDTVACEVADAVLRALALPYSTHPAYQEEWRP